MKTKTHKNHFIQAIIQSPTTLINQQTTKIAGKTKAPTIDQNFFISLLLNCAIIASLKSQHNAQNEKNIITKIGNHSFHNILNISISFASLTVYFLIAELLEVRPSTKK